MSTTTEALKILKHIADKGGELQSVEELISLELPDDARAFVLRFVNATLALVVNPDDDTIEVRGSAPPAGDEQRYRPSTRNGAWSEAVHRSLQAGWIMINQQGYEDAIQLEFANPGETRGQVIQLVAIASSIKVYERSSTRL